MQNSVKPLFSQRTQQQNTKDSIFKQKLFKQLEQVIIKGVGFSF